MDIYKKKSIKKYKSFVNLLILFKVNKSFVKFVTDFGPLLVFLFFYYNSEKNLKIAIPPFIVATLISLFVVWFIEKKIPMIPLIGGILITLFGGLTIYFDNPIFMYIKPTIINILFGLSLLFGKFFTKEPVLKKILGKSIMLTDLGWNILNKRWMIFFFVIALLNEFVWRTQSEEFWVNFKVWGLLPITFIFTAFQVPLITKHKIDE
jgi:intracellular septation protein|tara:strand:+ start:148 stop:768 length:621 start_codon:yes stop_codon:yes gene_type:complete